MLLGSLRWWCMSVELWLALFLVLVPVSASYSLMFDYTGKVQSFTVPENLAFLAFNASGASGEGYTPTDATLYHPGGLGGHILVNSIPAAPFANKTLYVYVGGQGAFGGGGGKNGCSSVGNFAGVGGGATDVRMAKDDLASRILVAGGGGGAGSSASGGAGGGTVGAEGGTCSGGCGQVGGGGSQIAGGSSSCGLGEIGQGGKGSSSGGGGGGGYFGGGGGETGSGGGGGSSYANSNYTITTNKQGVNTGNGALYVSFTCQAGYFLHVASCIACAANTFSSEGASACSSSCPSGTFPSGGNPSACFTPTLTFAFNSHQQGYPSTWTVPSSVDTFTINAYGAARGDFHSTASNEGKAPNWLNEFGELLSLPLPSPLLLLRFRFRDVTEQDDVWKSKGLGSHEALATIAMAATP